MQYLLISLSLAFHAIRVNTLISLLFAVELQCDRAHVEPGSLLHFHYLRLKTIFLKSGFCVSQSMSQTELTYTKPIHKHTETRKSYPLNPSSRDHIFNLHRITQASPGKNPLKKHLEAVDFDGKTPFQAHYVEVQVLISQHFIYHLPLRA